MYKETAAYGSYRLSRVNEEMTKEMANILREVKDPRVSGSFTVITGCEISADFKYAKVYYSFLDKTASPEQTEEKRKEIKKGLISANGFIRRELARRLNLRVTPELTYIADTSAEYGDEINRILRDIKNEHKTNGDADE